MQTLLDPPLIRFCLETPIEHNSIGVFVFIILFRLHSKPHEIRGLFAEA
jgi:hypothetical protein